MGLHNSTKSFTLIELMIVIAILAILAAAVVIILNPTELLAQSRDGTRFSDLTTLTSALNASTVNSVPLGSNNIIYVSIPDPALSGNATSTCADLGLPTIVSTWTYQCVSPQNYKDTNGTGWIPVNENLTPGGPTVPTLPVDPLNSTSSGNYYLYSTNGTSWTIQVPSLESSKFQASYPNGYQTGGFSGPPPWRKNWIIEPNFETPGYWTEGWSGNPTSTGLIYSLQDPTHFLYGTDSANFQSDASAQDQWYLINSSLFTPIPKSTYTFSAYIFVPTGSLITTMNIYIKDINWNTLSRQTTTLVPNTWTRVSTSYTAPVGSPQWRLIIADPGTTGIATWWVDDTLLEVSKTTGSYFDGSFTTSSPPFFWDVTANNSTSEN